MSNEPIDPNDKEYLAIKEQLRIKAEDERKQLISTSSSGECSPTSLRLSPELKSKAKKLAYIRYNKTEVSQLLHDLLIEALKKEGLI